MPACPLRPAQLIAIGVTYQKIPPFLPLYKPNFCAKNRSDAPPSCIQEVSPCRIILLAPFPAPSQPPLPGVDWNANKNFRVLLNQKSSLLHLDSWILVSPYPLSPFAEISEIRGSSLYEKPHGSSPYGCLRRGGRIWGAGNLP